LKSGGQKAISESQRVAFRVCVPIRLVNKKRNDVEQLIFCYATRENCTAILSSTA